MGNAVTKKFDLPKEHTACAGHVSNWKIWPGNAKDTGEPVSIWAFEKNDLFKRKTSAVTDKALVEQIFQIMKKDLNLLKEAQCDSIVACKEVVEESKTALVFTTERIVCSLADILNNCENVPGGLSEQSKFFEKDRTVSEIEVSRGLLHVAEGLQYLHTVQRKLHLNVTPESVVITSAGQWKLCGFGFSLSFSQGEQQRLASPYFLKAVAPNVNSNTVSRLEPDLRYSGPEMTDGGLNPPDVRYLTPAADLFSLGMVFYEVYKFNLKLTSYERSYYRATVPVTNNDAAQHHLALQALQNMDLSFMPAGAAQMVMGLIQLNTHARSTATDVVNNSYFVTGTQATLNMVNLLHTRDLGTQSSQMISLQDQLSQFPARVLMLMIMPAISKLCVAQAALWVYALPLHVYLSKQLPGEQYQTIAGPYISAGLAETAQLETMQAFLSCVEFIATTFGAEFFQRYATTLFCNALEKPNLYIQNLAMEKLSEPVVYKMFEPDVLAEKLMPQLCKDACKNPEPSIKTQALYVISLLTCKLDETFIAANVLPSLKYITDSEKNPAVSMCVVGNYESISTTLGPEYLATSILPVLQGMLLDRGLDKTQFITVVNMIKRMLKRILDIRTNEFDMPAISMAEQPGVDEIDPFANPKAVIATSKRNNEANNYGMAVVGGSSGNGAPPVPRAPPPPAPSAPPPSLPPGEAPPPLPTQHAPNINDAKRSGSISGYISAFQSSSTASYGDTDCTVGASNDSSSTGTLGSGMHVSAPYVSAFGANTNTSLTQPAALPPPVPTSAPPANSPTPASSTNGLLSIGGGATTSSSVGGYGSTSTTSNLNSSSTSTNTTGTGGMAVGADDLDIFGGGEKPSASDKPSKPVAVTGAPATSTTKSAFGWFSSSKSTAKPSNKSESGAEYAPPSTTTVATAAAATANTNTACAGGGATSLGAMLQPTVGGNSMATTATAVATDNMEDFLSSFGQKPLPPPINLASGTGGGGVQGSTGAGYNTNKANANSALANNTTGVSSTGYVAPVIATAPTGGISGTGLNIEEQILQTQREIARLTAANGTIPQMSQPQALQNQQQSQSSATTLPNSSFGQPSVGSLPFSASAAPASNAYSSTGSSGVTPINTAYSGGAGQMPYQQQQYGMQQQYNVSSTGGPLYSNAPQPNIGVSNSGSGGQIAGFSFSSNNNSVNGAALANNSGRIGSMPNAGGYQPPVAAAVNMAGGGTSAYYNPANQAGMPQYNNVSTPQQSGNKVDSAFDFLN